MIHSRVLSALAMRVASDPFAKIKKMVKDLIIKLMEEANEEASHKGWCDTELSTNKQTREQKTEAVQTLTAEIDELKASLAKLTEDITALTQGVAELDSAMSESTALRTEAKAKNESTIADAEAAQTAVAQALTVLKEFYAKAAEASAASFVQVEEKVDNHGIGQDSSGVIGMLEVIESDFARLEADTKAAEAVEKKEYDAFMLDSKMDKTKKATDLKHKEAKKQDQSETLTVKTEDLEGTQKELTAAIAYYDKLKPSCVDTGVSYDDKVERRKEEIESLQEALKILNGEDLR
jgi:chromosome segregation ATPase